MPTPGGPDEAEDRPLHRRVELAHREVLEDAVLGLLEARVIGVEHALGARQVDHFVGALAPRQRDQPVEIRARDRVFGGRDRHLRQPIELALGFLLDRVRHAGGFDLFAKLFDFLGLIVAFAELLLNRLHLLAQEVFALVLADLRLHLRLDLRAQLEHLGFLDEQAVEQVQPRAHVDASRALPA